MSTLSEFFEFMWHNTEGWVYLPSCLRDSNGDTDDWRRRMYKWPAHAPAVEQHVVTMAAEGREVYFSPAIYKDKQPTKDNVLGSHVLWVDFDGNAPAEWAHPDNDLDSGQPGSTTPVPSLRVQSSSEGNQHVYWSLKEFCTDVTLLEDKNRALAYKLRADTSGWDANQILRPPETTNFKRNLPVQIAEETGDSFPIDRFSYLPAPKQIVEEELQFDSLVPVESILAKYTWSSQFYEVFSDEADTLDRSAALMKIGYFGAEIGMTDVEIFSLLVHADDRWGKFKKRADRQRRLTDIVNRARLKHPVPLTSILANVSASDSSIEVDKKYVFNFGELLDADFKIEWLIPGLISRGGSAIIASAPGVGKTQFCIRLAMALATGENFLGWNIPQAGKAFFMSLEMSGPPLKQFVSIMAADQSAEQLLALSENFNFMPLGEDVPIDRPEGKKLFEQILDTYKPDLLVIDSLGKLISGKLTDDELIRQSMSYIARLQVQHQLAIIMIHHNRKATENNKKPHELGDIYGSQYITSSVDQVASLWREGDDIEYRDLKNRLSAQRSKFSFQRTGNLNFISRDAERLSSEAEVVGGHFREGGPVRNDKSDDGAPNRDFFEFG